MTTDTERAEYVAGLRDLATILEQHPELPLPYHGRGSELLWIATYDEDHKELARTFARLIPGQVRKEARGTDFDLVGSVAGLKVQMILDRDQVCQRVVTGTTETTREVPDADALAKVPTTTVTETVEQVEWQCGSLLSSVDAAPQTAVSP